MFEVKKRVIDVDGEKAIIGTYGQGSGEMDWKGIMNNTHLNWNVSEGDTLMITRFSKDNLTGEDNGVEHLNLYYPEWQAILKSFSPDYLRKVADEIEKSF